MALNTVEKIDDRIRIRRAIVSVSDKAGLERFVPGLLETCPDLTFYSTGGTHSKLVEILGDQAERLHAISDYTGQPEMQGGLVKTLDFKIYLGLLSETYNPHHAKDLERTGAVAFDLVVVNLYPFNETVAEPDVTIEQARANIDIGGPCMLRASAKNFHRVAVVVDPAGYDGLVEKLKASGGALDLATRFELARKAFAHTAAYDAAISTYLAGTDPASVGSAYTLENSPS